MTKPLSPAQTQILTSAVQHSAQLAEAPPNLPAAARNVVFQSMLRAGLLEEVSGDNGTFLRVTEAGLTAVRAQGPPEPADEATGGPPEGREGQLAGIAAPQGPMLAMKPSVTQPRTSLRDATTALLAAWDAGLERPALPSSIKALRAAVGRRLRQGPIGRNRPAPRTPREGTKQQAVLALLGRPEGTTIAQIMEATGWAQHTIRGFLAGLKRNGHAVEVLERVRQIGPGSQGAKGSYSIYRIARGEQGTEHGGVGP